MKMKKLIIAAAAGALALMTGCSSAGKRTVVTEEEAPSDLLKSLAAITSESSSSDVLSAFYQVLETTVDAYDERLKMDQTTETSSMTIQSDTLASVTSSSRSIDVRYGQDTKIYELLEQKSDDTQVMGMMEAGAKGTTTLYATYDTGGVGESGSELTLDSFTTVEDDTEYTDSDLEAMVRNTIIYPLYSLVGANLILQPFTNPEYYDFTLEKEGESYIFTASINDTEAYNAYLDDYVESNYGYTRYDLNMDGSFVVETYDTQKVEIVMTMDENGVLTKLENNTYNVIGNEGNEVEVYSYQTCKLSQADESYLSFFEEVFAGLADGTYKEGSTLTLPSN